MSSIFTISSEEINSEKWDKAREMCARYGYDIHEIASGLARFRMIRAEFRAKALAEHSAKQPVPVAAPSTVAHFNSVKQFWDSKTQRWTKPGLVYMGRAMPHLNLNLPASPFANPFRIDKDTDDARTVAIELYAEWILNPKQAHLLRQIDSLRGQILVCWCFPRHCHCDVIVKLLRDKDSYADVQSSMEKPAADETAPDYQPTLKLTAF